MISALAIPLMESANQGQFDDCALAGQFHGMCFRTILIQRPVRTMTMIVAHRRYQSLLGPGPLGPPPLARAHRPRAPPDLSRYPHCNRDADRTPVIGWAGWDQLQQAQAVAGYYERMRTNEGWTDDRLLPLLAGVLELLPWLLQWHNALDPQYGMGLGDFFRSFSEEEARRMGKTLDEVRAWKPPGKLPRKGTKAAKREKDGL